MSDYIYTSSVQYRTFRNRWYLICLLSGRDARDGVPWSWRWPRHVSPPWVPVPGCGGFTSECSSVASATPTLRFFALLPVYLTVPAMEKFKTLRQQDEASGGPGPSLGRRAEPGPGQVPAASGAGFVSQEAGAPGRRGSAKRLQGRL